MISNSRTTGRAGRVARALALVSVLALGASACSGEEPDAAPDGAGVTADAEKASTALDAGLAAHAAGDLTGATVEYNKVLTYDTTNKFALYNLALIDEANANYGLAEAHYRSALETDPAYEPALFNLAILRTGPDPLEAISLYESAVIANDTNASAWLNLGLLLRANGQVEAGDEDVLRAITLDPTLTDPAPVVEDTAPTTETTP